MGNFVIAVDGPTGSGKSTVVKTISKKFGIKYLDTGATFRTVTYKVLKDGLDPQNESDVLKAAQNINLKVEYKNNEQINLLDNENVNDKIRTPDVNANVGYIAKLKNVRLALMQIWRDVAGENDIIVDGRDIGSFVLPNANVKLYITASVDKRAERRYNELIKNGKSITFEEVKSQMQNVDHINETRDFSPAKPADDAIILDTTQMTIDEVLFRVEEIINHAKMEG